MRSARLPGTMLAIVSLASVLVAQSPIAPYKYIRIGNAADVSVPRHPGYALMGGGADLDEAFQWLCSRAPGGDFLILRAHGTDAYNPYVQGLCKLNSVATLILPSRDAANDPFVAKTIAHAGVIFIAGGDQANYLNFWMGTPVQTALNDAIRRGIPIGGTSAGLAVMGEWVYSAQGDKPDDKDLDSKTVLGNPYHPRVTLVHGFLEIPILKGIITDSHFASRDRMGRLLVFLARLDAPTGRPILPPGHEVRGIGVDERSAVLVEPDGRAVVTGKGSAYFIDWEDREKPTILKPGSPAMIPGVKVQRLSPGDKFDLHSWTGESTNYELWARDGVLHSTQPAGSIY